MKPRTLLLLFACWVRVATAGPGVRRYARGLKRGELDFEDAANSPPLHRSKGRLQSPPQHLDWRRTEIVTAVKNQGECGMCWAVSSTSTIESRYIMHYNNGYGIGLSYQQVASCTKRNEGCCGGCPENTFKDLNKTGGWLTNDLYWKGSQTLIGDAPPSCDGDACKKEHCTESCKTHKLKHDVKKYPDDIGPLVGVEGWSWVLPPCLGDKPCRHHSDDWLKLSLALAEEGPLNIDVQANVWDDANLSSNEVLTYEKCPDAGRGDHSVQLVGYNLTSQPPYWIVRNSWGSTWGANNGFLFLEYGKNTCGIGDAVLTVDVKGRKAKSDTEKEASWKRMYEQAILPSIAEVIV